VASIARALADPTIARAAEAIDARRRGYWPWLSVSAAVAAALFLVLGPVHVFRRATEASHRSPTLANGSLPTSVAPIGEVAAVSQLRWTAVPGADRYRVTVFDADGRVVYEASPTDAVATLPDSLVLIPGQRYLWRVAARVGFDRWVSSNLVEFTLLRDSRR
jgi:hypothetical protein